jgi:hypothetical protein
VFTIELKRGNARRGIQGIYDSFKTFVDFIIKFRYLIALVVFFLLVLFKINGSNIGCWSSYVDEGGKNTVVAGKAQDIRSDEWGVLFPIFFSQQNSVQPFSVNNTSITPSGQNVVLTLDAPVLDIYTICHPQNWGFLFLNADHALSWYWDMKQLLILLLGFELAMILTKRHRYMSLLGAFWIWLSPAIQWWFAQHVGNETLFFMAIVVTFYYFLKFHDRLPQKAVFAFLFSLSCLGYVTPVYPALQVPFGFLAILLMVFIALDFRGKFKINRSDIIIVSVAALFTLGMLGHLYLLIKDAIVLEKNTVYPGHRVSTGGGSKNFYIFAYLTNPLLPFSTVKVDNGNACELSSFYNFLPAVLLALPALYKKKKESIRYGVGLALFAIFFIIYMTWSFVPQAVAKITLLSYVTGSRAMLAYSFAAMLLSIWAFAAIARQGGVGRIYAAVSTLIVAVSYFACYWLTELKGSTRIRYALFIFVVFIVLNYLLLRGHKKLFSAGMACVILGSGLTINPINIGAGAILNNTLSSEIRAVYKMDKTAEWLPDETVNWLGGTGILIYANGAKSVGGINNYPDMGKWSKIDPKHKYANIYNRSAHVSFCVVGTTVPTTFTLHGVNAFRVNINVGDLKKLSIKYIVSNRDLTGLDSATVHFKALFARDGKNYTIYRVSYS